MKFRTIGAKTLLITMLFSVSFTMSRNALQPPEVSELPQGPKRDIPTHPSRIDFEQHQWRVPSGEPYRNVLNNGLRAYIAIDSTLPLVEIEGYINHSPLNDPQGKQGLGALMSRLLRLGGTEQMRGDSINELLATKAIQLSFSQSESHITFNGSFLSEYLDTALTIIEQLFFYPAFDQQILNREKNIMKEAVRHRFVNPPPTLSAAYRKQLFGNSNASRLTTIASLDNIDREDLVKLHKSVFTTDNIVISVAGNFTEQTVKSRLETIFPVTENARQIVPFEEIISAPSIDALIVHRPINQAYVRMGLPMFRRPHPDYYTASLLNMIIGGGGFTSRLGTKIRSDAGLTYSIHSRMESNYLYPGTFYIEFNTRTETLPLAISLIKSEVERFKEEGVTEDELANGKTALLSQLPSMFRSPGNTTATYAWNEFYGRSADHFLLYPNEIATISVEDVNRVAAQYLDPSAFTYTIVADTSRLNRLDTSKGFDWREIENRRIISTDEIERLP